MTTSPIDSDWIAQCESFVGQLEEMRDGTPPDRLSISTQRRLREQLGTVGAKLCIESLQRQKKAIEKLGPLSPGQRMWWITDRSLQQATPWQVARCKAGWWHHDHVFDLCCGIGGDALALARRGSVTAIDRDATIMVMANANLSHLPPMHSQIANHGQIERRCIDVTELKLPSNAAIHIDPDRRTERRSSSPESYQPSWESVLELTRRSDAAMVKLAPAADGFRIPQVDHHRCWISLAGSVREQTLLLGSAVTHAGLPASSRSAVIVARDGSHVAFAPVASQCAAPGEAGCTVEPDACLIDPDAAIRAAGLTETFAVVNNLKPLGGPAGFLTGDASNVRPEMAVVGQIIWWGPCDLKRIIRRMREDDLFPATIKVRGSDHDPNAMIRRFKKRGRHPVTLWITRAGHRVIAAITTETSHQSQQKVRRDI